ncbi:MAG: hypothetical protein AAF495_08930 [Pseudomonadota bacterium]
MSTLRIKLTLHALATAFALGGVGTVPAAAQADVQDNEVATRHIQEGAVTFAKLAPDAVFTNTIVVSPVGPTEQDNCLELQAALDSIEDASFNTPYLIHLEPGVYDCGDQAITMKPFVNIQGSGPTMTFIKGSRNGETGIVTLVSNAELSRLSVSNRFNDDGDTSVAVGTDRAFPLVDWRVSNVSAFAGSQGTLNYAIFLDSTDTCDGNMENVHAQAATVGGLAIPLQVECPAGTIRIDKLTTAAGKSFGIRKTGAATVTLFNSLLLIDEFNSPRTVVLTLGGQINFVNTQIYGTVDAFGLGVVQCLYSYDELFNPFTRDCQNTSFAATGVFQTQ